MSKICSCEKFEVARHVAVQGANTFSIKLKLTLNEDVKFMSKNVNGV